MLRRAVVVLGLLLVVAAAAGAAGTGEQDEFYRGTNLSHDGHYDEAVTLYLALAARSPADPFADDALIEAARLYEEKLGKPREAAETYERLAQAYPSSRLAIRAQRRAAELRSGMGTDADGASTLAEFNEILYGFARRPRGESIARLEQLLADHPAFGAAPRATHWLGTLHQQDGHLDQALARFREVQTRWPDSDWATRSRKAEGDVLLARHDWAGARAAYESLRGRGDPALERTAEEALRELDAARRYVRLEGACWLLLGLLFAAAVGSVRQATGSFAVTGRALVRPPLEVWYLLPVAGLFAGAAATEHSAIANAVLLIAVGAVAVTWLSGAALEAVRRARGAVGLPRVLVHVVACALAVAALCYIAIFREGLVELVKTTVLHGPD